MHRSLSRILLAVAGLGFLGFGIACLLAPLQVLAMAGVQVEGAAAATELRAMYGGLELGLALLLLAAAVKPAWLGPGLWLCLASYGGLGLARGVGMWIAQLTTPFFVIALLLELGLALLAALALWRDPATR